ncbi:MerR family transcriptional regulator [Lentzea sp. NPDC055074]
MTYTPRAVAAMLGIAPTTLRTWDQRYGLGPSQRSEGGHRRYQESDVKLLGRMIALISQGIAPAAAAELARQQAVSKPLRTRLPPDDDTVRAARRGFIMSANRLDEASMLDLAGKLVADHGVVAAWDSVFVPCMTELGNTIAERGSGVEIEHLASASVLQALRDVPRSTMVGVPAALLSTAPEEHHVLALEALGAALSEQDCSWRSLGARVPARALCDAVATLRPGVTLVWAHRADLAAEVPLNELHARSDTVLAAAGPGWADVELPSFVRRPATLTDAIELVLSRTSL